ncbi:hypothetical protein Tco_0138434 [Tanacetum coccineum]
MLIAVLPEGCIRRGPIQVFQDLLILFSHCVSHGGRGWGEIELCSFTHEWDPCRARVHGNRDCGRGLPSVDASLSAEGLRERPMTDPRPSCLLLGRASVDKEEKDKEMTNKGDFMQVQRIPHQDQAREAFQEQRESTIQASKSQDEE